VTGDLDLQARMPEESAPPQSLPALRASLYVTRDGEALSCSSWARMRESAASLRHNFMNSLGSKARATPKSWNDGDFDYRVGPDAQKLLSGTRQSRGLNLSFRRMLGVSLRGPFAGGSETP